jgi:hypothetical protein
MAWKIDPTGLMTDDGQPGGDVQVGKACSIRLENRELDAEKGGGHIHLVTVYVYPEGSERPETPGEVDPTSLSLVMQTEFMVCTDRDDPGSSEVWADLQYDILDTRAFRSIAEAGNVALGVLARFDPERDIHWDGGPIR